MPELFPRPLLAALLTLGAASAVAASPGRTDSQPGQTLEDRSTPWTSRLGVERVSLPGHESMGLAGATLSFELGEGWHLGPGVYGAATGQRGGLFVGGVELGHGWAWRAEQVDLDLFAGGGGGAAAPVGSGLMLRTSLAWRHRFGHWSAGLGWSDVRFPSGAIASRQPGLLLAWDGQFRHAAALRAGTAGVDDGRSGLGWDRFDGTLARLTVRQAGASRQIDLVGGRLMREGAPTAAGRWSWGLEAAGAAGGGAAGYMEALADATWSLPLAGPLQFDLRGAAGLAGGGAVPTGGGGIARVTAGALLDLGGDWSTGLAVGRTWTRDSGAGWPYAQWWVSLPLEPKADAAGHRSGTLVDTEWVATVQHRSRVARTDGSARGMDTVGLKLDRALGEHAYLSAQAHSAYAGGAGAYSMGLVGAGLASSTRPCRWRAGAEVLLGAGGGGGVRSGGGALAQALAWMGWRVGDDLEARLGVGGVRSLGGELSSPLLEVSLVRIFGQHAP
jgi:hypothetical protein